MSIDSIKESFFKQWFQSLSTEEKEQIRKGGISVFDLNSKLKSYLTETLGVKSVDDLNISDILNVKYQDGQVINSEDEEFYALLAQEFEGYQQANDLSSEGNAEEQAVEPSTDDSLSSAEEGILPDLGEILPEDGETIPETKDENDVVIGDSDEISPEVNEGDDVNALLEKLYGDANVLKAFGVENAGDITSDMKEKFENYLKESNGSNDLTAADVLRTYEEILSGEFTLPEDLFLSDSSQTDDGSGIVEIPENHTAPDDGSGIVEIPENHTAPDDGSGKVEIPENHTVTEEDSEKKTKKDKDKETEETDTPSKKTTKDTNNEAKSSTPSQSVSRPVSSGGGGGSFAAPSSGGVTGGVTTPSPAQEAPEVQTEDERLQQEYDDAKEELSTKQEAVDDIKSENEQELQSYQEEVDEKYEAYQEQLKEFDEELAAEIDEKNNEITSKEQEIDENDSAITDQESVVSESEVAYSSAQNRTQALKNQLSVLSGSEQTDNVKEQISELNARISEAESAEQSAKQKLEEDKNKLKELKDKKVKLEDELDTLNEEMAELEEKAAQDPDVKEKMEDWQEAKEELADVKTEQKAAVDEAQAEVVSAQERVNEAKAAIDEYNNKKEAEEFSVSSIDIDVDVNARLTDSQKADLEKFTQNYMANKEKYEEVAEKTGLAPEAIAAIHWRESSGNFNTYLHNGQPLGQVTTIVPKGIYFEDWTEAAIDAIKGQNDDAFWMYASDGSNTDISSTGKLSDILVFTERYNGYGMRNKGLPSSYVWSGTTTYQGGRYAGDGDFRANENDDQLGTAIMIKTLLDMNV